MEINSKCSYMLRAKIFFLGNLFKINNITSCKQSNHSHDYIQIWYVKSGQYYHWINNIKYQLKKGDIIVIPADVTHKIISDDSAGSPELIGCEFLQEFVCKDKEDSLNYSYLKPFLKTDSAVTPYIRLDEKTTQTVEGLFEDMVKEFREKENCFQLKIKADLLSVLSILLRSMGNKVLTGTKLSYVKVDASNRHREIVATVIDYVNDNYMNRISLEEISKIAMMSPTYFAHVFKEYTGKTFVEYVNYIRVQKSVRLLEDKSLNVSEIGLRVGFKDAAYFDRIFRKEYGVAPGKFRKFL